MHLRPHWALLVSLIVSGSSGAWASDLQCANTQQAAERVICDHAILNNEYDDIFAQQQALLNAGRLSQAQVAQWKQARNACTDVHCIDVVFSQWKGMAKSLESGAGAAMAPAIASSTEMAPVGPIPGAEPATSDAAAALASGASPTSEASLVQRGSAAGVALPQPVETQASASAAASSVTATGEANRSTGMGAGLLVIVLVAIAALGWAAFVKLRKKR